MNFAGLDIGTTGTKALVVDESGRQLAAAYRNYRLYTPLDGWCELNPDDIWNACKEVLREIAEQTAGRVDSIAVCSHAQAVVPLDRHRHPLYNFISTVDTRTERELLFWKNNRDEYRNYLKTGLPFSPIYTANKLMWLRQNCPEVFQNAQQFLCVQDFINQCLTGSAVMDLTLAGRGMLLNVQKKQWDEEILQTVGVRPEQLARLAVSGTEIDRLRPELARELGIDQNCTVFSGGHDQACGCIGSGVFSPGQAMNSCGTVEVLDVITPDFITDPKILSGHYPCTPFISEAYYHVMSINNSGGSMLKWYLNTFCRYEKEQAGLLGVDPYSYLIEAASKEVSDVYVLPHLNGAETPVQDAASACAFVHLRSVTKKEDITRGVLDSLAYEMRLNRDALAQLGCGIEEIHAIGGGARSSRLLQIKADVLQTPIVTPAVREAAALGAAMIGAVGLGVFDTFEDAARAMVRYDRVFEPDRSLSDCYRQHFEEYRKIYPSMRELNRTISDRIHPRAE